MSDDVYEYTHEQYDEEMANKLRCGKLTEDEYQAWTERFLSRCEGYITREAWLSEMKTEAQE